VLGPEGVVPDVKMVASVADPGPCSRACYEHWEPRLCLEMHGKQFTECRSISERGLVVSPPFVPEHGHRGRQESITGSRPLPRLGWR
jgi:hypothetical protein